VADISHLMEFSGNLNPIDPPEERATHNRFYGNTGAQVPEEHGGQKLKELQDRRPSFQSGNSGGALPRASISGAAAAAVADREACPPFPLVPLLKARGSSPLPCPVCPM
jgi:hypothetical protein